MGMLATQEPGVLVSAVFELGKKGVNAELAALQKRLAELQAKDGLSQLVVATRREGKKLRVKVLASTATPPKGAKAKDAKAAEGRGGWGRKKR